MDIHARRRQAGIGIAYLMEVVASTLQEAYDNGEGGLMATVVAERAGIPTTGDSGGICRYILDRLRIDGVAVDDQPGPGAGSWRLAD